MKRTIVEGFLAALLLFSTVRVVLFVRTRRLLSFRWPKDMSPPRFSRYCGRYLKRNGWIVALNVSGDDLFLRKKDIRLRIFCRTGTHASRFWLSEAQKWKREGQLTAVVTDAVIPSDVIHEASDVAIPIIHYSALPDLESLWRLWGGTDAYSIMDRSQLQPVPADELIDEHDSRSMGDAKAGGEHDCSTYYCIYRDVNQALRTEGKSFSDSTRSEILRLIELAARASAPALRLSLT